MQILKELLKFGIPFVILLIVSNFWRTGGLDLFWITFVTIGGLTGVLFAIGIKKLITKY